jgi:2-hydroxy-3-keto-5-methylthiopentenyl-1-phosphate phosphatase
MAKRLQIYSDFDGTIAVNDISNSLFATYAGNGWEQPIIDWKQ